MLTSKSPIDVVKRMMRLYTHRLTCAARSQIDDVFKGKGMLTVGRSIVAKEGTKGLLTGFGPTAVGYLLQGGGKARLLSFDLLSRRSSRATST